MEHIVDWFVVFMVLIGITMMVERLSWLLRRQKSRRHLQTMTMSASKQEAQESLISALEQTARPETS